MVSVMIYEYLSQMPNNDLAYNNKKIIQQPKKLNDKYLSVQLNRIWIKLS